MPNGHHDGDDERIKRHRTHMAGLWAAELLGLIGQAAHDYARDLVHAEHHAQGDAEHVLGRLSRDLHGKAGAAEIRAKLAHFLREARRQILDANAKAGKE
jgi:hypothetical protein